MPVMCDNCRTSVSGTVHIHVVFHFNGAESAENSLPTDANLD